MSWMQQLIKAGYVHSICRDCWDILAQPDTASGGEVLNPFGCCFCGRTRRTTWRTRLTGITCQDVHWEDV